MLKHLFKLEKKAFKGVEYIIHFTQYNLCV